VLFGFVLGETRANDAEQWAAREHVACTMKRERSVFQCRDVGAGLALDELTFTFDTETGKLRDLSGYRFRLPAAVARTKMMQYRTEVLSLWGLPDASAGDWSLPVAGHFETATMRYRYADLAIDVTASALPQGTTTQVRAGLF
jgi:hypothetical protein